MSVNTIDRNEFIQRIEQLEDLPTLPAVAQQVIALTSDPNANFKRFGELIQSDPPLAAKVMKTANSVYYGRLDPAKTLQDAIFTIGLNDISSICSSVGVIQSFSHWEQENIDHRTLWKHAISTAMIAKSVVEFEDIYGAINFFLAGLLHDIGWMIVDHLYPEAVGEIIKAMQDDESWSYEREHEILGVSHAEVGAIVLRRWNIAEELVTLTRWHHNPEGAEGLASHACLLQLASDLTPYEVPFDPKMDAISPYVPLEVSSLETEIGMAELRERYEKLIKKAVKFTDVTLV